MIGTMLEGAASGLVSNGVQQLFTDYNREQDFGNYQKAVQQNFVNAQDLQRNAPMLTKLGMQAAGLNPAQMNNPIPASAASAPLGAHASPVANFANDTAALAQSRLSNAEAEKTELQNEQTTHANESSFETYKQNMDSIATMYEQRGMDDYASNIRSELENLDRLKKDGKLDWNLGDLQGAVKAFGAVDKMQERLQQQLEKQFEVEKNLHLILNDRAVDVAQMPKLQRDLLTKQISLSAAQTALFASEKDVNDQQILELIEMQQKLKAETAQLVYQKKLTQAQANMIENADWKSLFKNGHFLQGGIAFLDDYTKLLFHSLGGLLGPVAQIKGAKMIGDRMGTKTVQHEYVPSNVDGGYHGYKPQAPSFRRTMLQRGTPLGNDDYDQ